jgi:hypothetical protein
LLLSSVGTTYFYAVPTELHLERGNQSYKHYVPRGTFKEYFLMSTEPSEQSKAGHYSTLKKDDKPMRFTVG